MIHIRWRIVMDIKVGFIGAGNMGSAIIRGIVASKAVEGKNIYVFDPVEEVKNNVANETGAHAVSDNDEVIKNSNVVFLCVKPNMVGEVLGPCAKMFTKDKIFVSIAVSVPISYYEGILGDDKKIIRALPNTPALVGEGMTLISYNKNLEENDIEIVKGLFDSVGKTEVLEEKFMDEVTAVTSSSPAYVFMFIEAMADAAVLSGIKRDLAYKLAAQAVLGSAKMVLETGKHPGALKDQVCSPAGTTIEAVYSLEKTGFRYSIMEAMNECTKKARKIGEKMRNK